MTAPMILSRLAGVRPHGTGWRADCSNGHTKARGSLSITQADDGRVMLHCFACGDTPGILAAVGLELADLFPVRIKDLNPEARKASAEAFKRNAWGAALGVLGREASIALLAVRDVLAGKALPAGDVARLAIAVDRIARAREVLA